jgi:tetratricopeptide (TPR) repeat protein
MMPLRVFVPVYRNWGCVVTFRSWRYVALVLLPSALWPISAWGQATIGTSIGSQGPGSETVLVTVDLSIHLNDPDGKPVQGQAVVTLTKLSGEFYRQETTRNGHVVFTFVPPTEYNVQVVAQAYQRTLKHVDAQSGISVTDVSVEMRPVSAEDLALTARMSALKPKAQKELAKAMEELRANDLAKARTHLEAAHRMAPDHAEVNYLFGVYSSQSKDSEQARSYWTKTLELDPKHEGALLSLSQMLLSDNKASEALPLLNRAVAAEPSSWRAHAMLASAEIRLGLSKDAIREAERALELGQQQAAIVQRLLATALAKSGDRERALSVLQSYVNDHPADAEAKADLERFQKVIVTTVATVKATSGDDAPVVTMPAGTDATESEVDAAATSLPLPSSWLPPGVDDKVPPIEPGAVCSLKDVIQQAGKRVQEFVSNVDRYTATESLVHQSVNKWGLPSPAEARTFGYVAEIAERKPGFFNVEEYRSVGGFPGVFPGGVETRGLPALALIFHPDNVGNFDVNCEGLAQRSDGLAWQVHFRQRADRPNTMKRYRIGAEGQSYPVAIKGRAWIAADTFQIVRLETDLIAPMQNIRLTADRAVVEYGSVHFRERHLDMWLPQSADVYFDWQGHRVHRRHSFSDYLLFSIDDKQQIGEPEKVKRAAAPPPVATTAPN